MVTTNVEIIANVSEISILVHDEYQNWKEDKALRLVTRHSWMQIARTNYLNQSSCLLLTFFNQLYHPSIKSLSTLYSYGDYKCWNHCKRKRNFYLSPWWISEFVLWSPLRVFITTSNYNNHFICSHFDWSRNHSLCYINDLFKVSRILQIFLVCYLRNSKSLVIYCVLWSYLYSEDDNRNRIIRITGLIFFKNIRHVDDPVGR